MEDNRPTTLSLSSSRTELWELDSHVAERTFLASNRRDRPAAGTIDQQITMVIETIPWGYDKSTDRILDEAKWAIAFLDQVNEDTDNGRKAMNAHREAVMYKGYVENSFEARLAEVWVRLGRMAQEASMGPVRPIHIDNYFTRGSIVDPEDAVVINSLQGYTRATPLREARPAVLLELLDRILRFRDNVHQAQAGHQKWELSVQNLAYAVHFVEWIAEAEQIPLWAYVQLYLRYRVPAEPERSSWDPRLGDK